MTRTTTPPSRNPLAANMRPVEVAGRINWITPEAYRPNCGEMLRQSIIEREREFNADLRIIGYGLALAYLFVVVFQIARVL